LQKTTANYAETSVGKYKQLVLFLLLKKKAKPLQIARKIKNRFGFFVQHLSSFFQQFSHVLFGIFRLRLLHKISEG
jgi:hypothetical protein